MMMYRTTVQVPNQKEASDFLTAKGFTVATDSCLDDEVTVCHRDIDVLIAWLADYHQMDPNNQEDLEWLKGEIIALG